MSAVALPCASRRPGHRHVVAWAEAPFGAEFSAEHSDPDLWIWLAYAELTQTNVTFDGALWQPNPRDGWNALAYLQNRSEAGNERATRLLREITEAMTRW